MSDSIDNFDLRLKELDALRGIAALMVVFFHYTLNYPDVQGVFVFGTTGVDLFFIISGFVIFMSLSKVKTEKEFMINRFARLYPTYWAAVTMTLFLKIAFYAIKGDGNDFGIFWQYLANMTMFQFYFGVADMDGPYWTMIIEMIFYLLMVLLFRFNLLKNTLVIGMLITIILLINGFFFPSETFFEILYWIPLLQFFALFFAGVVFYHLYMKKGIPTLNYSLLLVCLITQITLFELAGRSNGFISQTEYGFLIVIFFVLFLLFVNGHLNFIVNRITLFFGRISYSLYLIHQFISVSIIIPVLVLKLNVNFWVASLLVALPVSVFMAYMINRFIEIPANRMIRNRFLKLK